MYRSRIYNNCLLFARKCYSVEAAPSAVLQPKKEQKYETNTLLDTHGRFHNYLRISLTEKCNLRCQYCMPADGVKLTEQTKLLTTAEIVKIAKLFAEEGVNKIRLTGGEPTIRKDLTSIIAQLKEIDGIEMVAMTTNGIVLTKKLVALQRAGLDVLNISLDTMKSDKYEKITRRKGWDRVMMGIDLALQLGYKPVKVNCVMMKGFNDDELIDFVSFTKDRNVDVRFIEYMPFSGNKWEVEKMFSYKDMVSQIRQAWPDFQPLDNHPNDTSKAWKVPGFAGQVGFITSMSEHFCGSCNRLRVTADGNLKVCLFGNKEISLRDALRSDCSEDDLKVLIGLAVKNKKKQHADGFPATTTRTRFNNQPIFKIPRSHLYIPLHITNSLTAQRRYYCTSKKLTHTNEEGKAVMVDVSEKTVTTRTATAKALVHLEPRLIALIKENNMKKGDVLSVSQLAGIVAAKKTAELIPLCHNITLTNVNVKAALLEDTNAIEIIGTVKSQGKTGVEMEALTAVTIAALTVYDMCKAVSHNIMIGDVCLVSKTGGMSGNYLRGGSEKTIQVRPYDSKPLIPHATVVVGAL